MQLAREGLVSSESDSNDGGSEEDGIKRSTVKSGDAADRGTKR